jgi:hypothetical protein
VPLTTFCTVCAARPSAVAIHRVGGLGLFAGTLITQE